MLLTPEQLERACGFLLLNEFNAFSYCCKSCTSEFESGPELEAHVLDHQDVKTGFESVFVPPSDVCESIEPWNDADQELMPVEELKHEIKVEPFPVQDERNVQDGPYVQDEPYEQSYQSTSDNESFGIFGSEDDYDSTVKNVSIEKNATEKSAIEKCYFKRQSSEKHTKRSKKYYCDMCPHDTVNFTRKVDIKQHLLRNHVIAWKPCPICKEMTAYLPRHMKAQHPGITKPYQCTYCPSAFKAESAFQIHIRSHTGERPFLCNLCGEKFTMANVLAIHIDRVHKTKEILPYECTECDLRFRLAQFEKHRLAIHNDSQPHVCTICGAKFKKIAKLRKHNFTHGERTFKCQYCYKTFKTNDYKRLHERNVHENSKKKRRKNSTANQDSVVNIQSEPSEKIEHSNPDGESTRNNQVLGTSMEIHNDSQFHVCNICGAKFIKMAKLRKHSFTHGERTFQCQYCYKMFKTNDYKRLHERNVHENAKKKRRKNSTANQDSVVNMQSEPSEKIEHSNPDGEFTRNNQILGTSMEFL